MFRSLILLVVLPVYTLLAGFIAIPVAAVTGSSFLLYSLGRLGVRIGSFSLGFGWSFAAKRDCPETPTSYT